MIARLLQQRPPDRNTDTAVLYPQPTRDPIESLLVNVLFWLLCALHENAATVLAYVHVHPPDFAILFNSSAAAAALHIALSSCGLYLALLCCNPQSLPCLLRCCCCVAGVLLKPDQDHAALITQNRSRSIGHAALITQNRSGSIDHAALQWAAMCIRNRR